MENTKHETVMIVIWAQSLIAALGSLFYSEVLGYVPCELCWIQRILMYPLVIIYGTALVKKDVSMALPGLILSGIGIVVSVYHYLVQKWPTLQDAGEACGVVPCHTAYVNYFGFVTIPFLAGMAFMIIFLLHLLLWKSGRR
ncbi:disulfide oxidoreductase [Lentibacillus salinarum]|uniref:Probable disulfide formation protein n=1 Tax=Lentibacillus salinarum TaxID=446820 RepID=A0ABW3ZRH4_9BACI